MRTPMLVLAGLLLASVACSSSSEAPADLCPSPTTTTSVEMKDFEYSPSCVAVAPGATLSLTNSGQTPHTFTVKAVDKSTDVAAGGSGSLDLSGVAAGTYEVTCIYHPQMTAAVKIG
jgi:plastocyanin